jgi:glyoxylase-like metal-dependent hydrolase (beta-lactamase superfamily II)
MCMNRLQVVPLLAALCVSLVLGPAARALRGEDVNESLRRLEAAAGPYGRALEAFRAGRFDRAEAELRVCLEKFAGHAYAHYYLANIQYIRKDYAAALASMDLALAGFDALAALDARVEDLKTERRHELRRALAVMAEGPVTCRESRSIEWDQDALEDEEFASERAAARRSQALTRLKAHYTYFRGNVLMQLRRVPEAMRGYEDAVRLDPRHGDAANNLMAIFFLAGEYEAAGAVLEKAEAAGVDETLNLELKERLLKALGRPVEGVLSEDLVAGQGPDRLAIRRFALAFRPSPEAGRILYVNAYVVFSPETRQAVLVDPGVADARIGDFIKEKGLVVRAVLVTHAHPDHCSAARFFAGEFGAPLCVPRAEASFFEERPDRLLGDGDRVTFEGLDILAVEIPGHTPGSLCYLAGPAVLTGDVLFRNDIGTLQGGSAKERDRARKRILQAIRDKIMGLPEATLVLPGHGKTTTVGAEKANNPFLFRR